ncbi:MAG: DegT/DnrJ/EryC1/StrS family aminotransferase [Candidatus Latescibacteria bacterium]|jgi:perosamine synthetase|nr:DegT/DnrJ/EryC1/StrS family aminotransferase [Candidatus Latescibacterota bacterium]
MTDLAINGGIPYRDTNGSPFPQRTPYGEREIELVTEAIRSQSLFRFGGGMVPEFETRFAEMYGVDFAIGSTSGTAALHVAMGAINPNPGDEVITGPITDMGTIIPILFQNAIPVFADTNPDTYTMDPEDVERLITPRTRAIIAIHLFGNSCDMNAIMEIAEKHKIPVIEDCSQSHLATYENRLVGTIGDIGCFSFQQSKHMSTGDGGMTVTSNPDYAETMRLFADKGYNRGNAEGHRMYRFLGINYRMTELHAAVGLAQLDKVQNTVSRRRCLGDRLSATISGCPGVIPAPVTPGGTHSYWLYPLRVVGPTADKFAKALSAEGIAASAGYIGKPIFRCAAPLAEKLTYGDSSFPFDSPYTDRNITYSEDLCPVTQEILDQLVVISFNENYTDGDIDDIGGAIQKVAAAISA